MKDKLSRVTLRTSLFYWLVAVLWILLSDRLLFSLVSDPATLSIAQTYKGWAFVTVTAALLYLTLRSQLNRWAAEAEARERSESALRESELRLSAITETARVGLAIIDAKHSYLYANPAYAAALGSDADRLVGQPVAAALGNIYEERVQPQLQRAFGGERVHYELALPEPGAAGVKRHYAVWYEPGMARAGVIVVAVTLDITERKLIEEEIRKLNATLEEAVAERTAELRRAKERAEHSDRVKSDFLANMSHELRTPLNAIIGFTELIRDEKAGPLNPRQREYLDDILASGRHLLDLINDILDLARVEADRLELKPEPFPLKTAVDQVCAIMKPFAARKRVTIAVRPVPGLDRVVLDQTRFKQILYNLVSNAVKFSREGGEVRISWQTDEAGDLRLQVEDDGIGIREDDLPRIFGKFEQLDTGPGRHYQGTGLGLALTKKIVELQRGSISVESEFGKGSRFTVVLPLASV
ncbi:MAG TPA: ATP-binding protein [candidate division Zixibacteria bacterium]|nr:ATP-binding protein [candidate division Zixibacteria bacterium]